VAPIFGVAPLYIKKDKKWQMPLIMRPDITQPKKNQEHCSNPISQEMAFNHIDSIYK
jgi:hypothetical protein